MFPCWRVWSHPQASEQLIVCSTGHNFMVQASTLQTLGKEAMCMWQCVREKRNCLPLGLQLLLQTRTKHDCTPSSLCSLVCENTCYQNMAMRLSEFLLWNHDHVPMHLGSRLVKTFRLPQTWCHSARGMVALWFCGLMPASTYTEASRTRYPERWCLIVIRSISLGCDYLKR